MKDLPGDVAAVLARAVGAYLRAMPAQEIPGALRRYQKFRPQSLPEHADELIGALDDHGVRARVLEWLEDKPRLSKREAELLWIASERRPDWKEQLRARAATRRRPPTGTRSEEGALQRERERARRAKDDARKAKEKLETSLASVTARVKELEVRIAALQKSVQEAERRARKAEADLERAERARERDSRRARKQVEEARAERDAFKKKAREAEREAAAASRAMSEAPRRTRPPVRTRSPRAVRERRERRPLKAPAGLVEEAPETLDAWLRTTGVHLLVDGYNVTKSAKGWPELSLERQRDLLHQMVERTARMTGAHATIVWDGSRVPPGRARHPRGRVAVEYSAPGEIADDHLIARLETLPGPVVVATSDRELKERARGLGASVARAEQLLALLR